MEWVETTGRTVQEAKEHALDRLGVAEDDAEFEVLDEPRPGLFGRLRGEARVRARVRPTQVRPKIERRDRRRKADGAKAEERPKASASAVSTSDDASDEAAETPANGDGDARPRRGGRGRGGAGAAAAREGGGQRQASQSSQGGRGNGRASEPAGARSERAARPAAARHGRSNGDDESPAERTGDDVDPQQVGDEAVRFVQGLVDAFGLEGTAGLRRDGDDLEVAVDGSDLGLLVGPRGTTLLAIQDLARVAAQRRLGDHDTRLRVDVAGYRERRREALARFANQVASEVISEGRARALEPMASADRKVIHDVLATFEGVVTRSEGDDPYRRVIISPADA